MVFWTILGNVFQINEYNWLDVFFALKSLKQLLAGKVTNQAKWFCKLCFLSSQSY
jgi:hypothetical protein